MANSIVFVSQESKARNHAWLNALKPKLPNENILLPEQVPQGAEEQIDLAIVANPDVSVLQRFLPLCWVQSLWAGVDAMVADARFAPFNIVKLTDPQLAQTMAESVLAWTLFLHKNMPQYAQQQAQQCWQPQPCALPAHYPVTILGAGSLAVASVAMLQRFGFDAVCWSRNARPDLPVPHLHGNAALNARLSDTLVLISLLPLTHETTGLVNAELMARLPAKANLINFSRGAVVDTGALLQMLGIGLRDICQSGDSSGSGDNGLGIDKDDTGDAHLAHAVLDVFEQEPLPANHPLWSHPSVTVLPHIAAPTSIDTASVIVAENIQRFRATGKVPQTVDRQKGY